MLKATDKQRSRGTNDMKVRGLAHQICKLWDDLENFERVFKLRIDKFPRLNTQIAGNCYRLVKPNDTTIEVWHKNSEGDQDRLLVEVVFEPEEIFWP
jgi:hypothetical protein